MAGGNERLIIVTGLSGSGKTIALHALEDLGYYCIDNLPIVLLVEFARHLQDSAQAIYEKVAVGIDARNPAESLSTFPEMLALLWGVGFNPELIFIQTDDEVLIKRFSETRRRHPLSTGSTSLPAAIRKERSLLEPLSEQADLRIDTSHTYIHQLRDLIRERVARRERATLSLQFTSFGYKHGIPPDADFVFDVRCLPNPYWETHLRQLTGQHELVAEFLEAQPKVAEMITELMGFLDDWVPPFEADNRSYLTVAIGCTGGHHRSVYVVERLAAHFRGRGKDVLITHRDI